MKNLVNKVVSKKVKFMGEDVSIRKLSVGDVMEIQKKSKEANENEQSALDLLQFVISSAVEGADELTSEDFVKFPIDELSKLSNEVLSYSGLGTPSTK